ncbi:type IV pilus assembly protein PilM [Candidatus Magnetomoraceae bacterium gMMP-1]
MLFGKKKNLVGLDIGSRSIKAGEVIESKEVRIIKRFGMIDIPQNIIYEGMVKDADALAEALSQLFSTYHIKQKNVAISVAGYSVIVKRINLPTMTEDELYNRIQYEAEQYIPFDIKDVNLDFQILGESEHNPGQMSVVLVAAKKDMINDYLHILDMVGITPCVIDVDCFALQNIYEINYSDDEAVALIDVGANKTNLNILKDRVSLFMRDVSLGGEQITKEIMSRVECTFDEAEELKQTGESELMSNSEFTEITSSTTMYWCSEIKRAIEFFYSTYSDIPLKKILLSGGGSNVKGFKSLLSAETSLEVEFIDPFQSFEVDSMMFDNSYLKRIAPQAGICLGLAMRKMGDK